MPEVAAAIGLAQLERIEYFIEKRIESAKMHRDVIKECTWLKEQVTPPNFNHTQWTFVVKIERDDISWMDFKKRYEVMEVMDLLDAGRSLIKKIYLETGLLKD